MTTVSTAELSAHFQKIQRGQCANRARRIKRTLEDLRTLEPNAQSNFEVPNSWFLDGFMLGHKVSRESPTLRLVLSASVYHEVISELEAELVSLVAEEFIK